MTDLMVPLLEWSIHGKSRPLSYIIFLMGPSVKFVLLIKDQISQKNLGGYFSSRKVGHKGGGGPSELGPEDTKFT